MNKKYVEQLYADGMIKTNIAKHMGVTRNRIDQILSPEKHKARQKTRTLIKTGKLKRPKICPYCRKRKFTEAHHQNYNDIWDILWLCSACHKFEHQTLRIYIGNRNKCEKCGFGLSSIGHIKYCDYFTKHVVNNIVDIT